MLSVQEMKELLSKEYGINSVAELNEALRKIGGIDIGIFVNPPNVKENGHEKNRVSA